MSRSEHPPIETIVAYHGRRVSAEERTAMREHCIRCADCARLLLDLAEFETLGPAEGQAPLGDRDRARLRASIDKRIKQEAASMGPPGASGSAELKKC